MTSNSAKEYFYQKKYEPALEIFRIENETYCAGLCSLLLRNEKDALKYWSMNKDCPASQWGLCVLELIL